MNNMSKFKGTQGKFKDGTTGWKVGKRETNGVKGFEIHWSDDGECITDHVYEESDAKLIAAAPELLENLERMIDRIEESNLQDNFPSAYQRAKAAINKATE